MGFLLLGIGSKNLMKALASLHENPTPSLPETEIIPFCL